MQTLPFLLKPDTQNSLLALWAGFVILMFEKHTAPIIKDSTKCIFNETILIPKACVFSHKWVIQTVGIVITLLQS